MSPSLSVNDVVNTMSPCLTVCDTVIDVGAKKGKTFIAFNYNHRNFYYQNNFFLIAVLVDPVTIVIKQNTLPENTCLPSIKEKGLFKERKKKSKDD